MPSTYSELFQLEIRLGNEAMRDSADIADALERLARRLRDTTIPGYSRDGVIRDENGNTVGGWSLRDPS